MRIELNELIDYEYVQKKLKEQAQALLVKAQRQHRPVRFVPQGLSGYKIKNWNNLPKYGRLLNNK